MLIGQYSSKIGPKRRVAIPKKIISEIGDSVVIAKWYENCLVMVSENQWNALLKRLIGETEMIIEPVRDIDRFILGSAFELSADTQGRVIIPDLLSDYAGFNDEIIFLGLGDRVELWDKNMWDEKSQDIEGEATKALEDLYKNER